MNHDVQMEKSEMQAYFKTMVTMRRMETEAESLYKEKKIRGFLHLYNGQVRTVAWILPPALLRLLVRSLTCFCVCASCDNWEMGGRVGGCGGWH